MRCALCHRVNVAHVARHNTEVQKQLAVKSPLSTECDWRNK